jgi:hypothetical protein
MGNLLTTSRLRAVRSCRQRTTMAVSSLSKCSSTTLLTNCSLLRKTNSELIMNSDQRSLASDSLQAGAQSISDHEARTKQVESILARLYPIEQAIMASPAYTITGLGVNTPSSAVEAKDRPKLFNIVPIFLAAAGNITFGICYLPTVWQVWRRPGAMRSVPGAAFGPAAMWRPGCIGLAIRAGGRAGECSDDAGAHP